MRMRPVRATPLSLALALALAALLLLCVAVPRTASAHSSLGCETVWEAPSKDNDILLCVTDVNRIKSQWRHYVFPALAVLLFVLVLVIFPLFFLCTLCASTCGTPPTEDEGKGSRCCLWMWIIYTLMWGFGVALFVIVGAKTMADAAVGTMNNTEIPLNFARGVKHTVEDLVQNQTVGDSQFSVPNLDLSAFDNVEELVNESMKQPRELLDKYVKYVPMVSYGVGALPIVLMSLVALVAFCRCCVPCLPLVLSWVYWAFGVVFSLLAIVMVVLAYVFSTLCGEIAAHNERDPGLLQWYLVPFCESTVNFVSIRNRINTAEKDVAGIACENLLKYCDNNNTGVGDLVSNVLSKFIGNPDEVKKLLAKLPPGTLPSGVDPSAIAQGGPLPEAVSELLSSGAVDANTLTTLASGGGLPPGAPGGIPGGLPGGIPSIPGVGALGTVGGIPGVGAVAATAASDPLGSLSSLLGGVKLLYCGRNITKKTDCDGFTKTASVLDDTKVKSFAGVCPENGKACTLLECSKKCKREEAKNISKKVVAGGELLRKAGVVLTRVRPLLECNFVIDLLLNVLSHCNDLASSAALLGAGFFLGGLMFACAIYVMLRGACVWRTRYDKEAKWNKEYHL